MHNQNIQDTIHKNTIQPTRLQQETMQHQPTTNNIIHKQRKQHTIPIIRKPINNSSLNHLPTPIYLPTILR